MARKFFYVCAGMFMLALSYHLGAGTAVAQAPSNSLVAVIGVPGGQACAFTANGDVYNTDNPRSSESWRLTNNVFAGAPVPTTHESWGQLKSRYR